MISSSHLAIDLGAESGRAIVGTLEEDRLELREVHRFEHAPVDMADGLHWDLDHLWSEIERGLRNALRSRRNDLSSVGVDTWGVDYVLLGPDGPLAPPFCYRDERTTPVFERVMSAVGAEAMYAATGIQPMAINTLFQLVAHHAADPGLVERAASLLFLPDYFHSRLVTDAEAVEATIASTSQMIEPGTTRWNTSLIERLGLPTAMLGPITEPGARLGTVPGTDVEVVLPGSHDTASAVAAVPADPSTSWCYLSSGTWSLLGAEIDTPCLGEAARTAPFTNEGGVTGTTRFLQNITGLWLVQECRRGFARAGHPFDYDVLTKLAGLATPFTTIVDPAHAPFLQPGDMPRRIADFARATGQPEPGEPGAIVRCCLESLALNYRRTLGQLETALARTFEVIHVVGGGAQNRLLNQMTADATGRTVLAGPFEATAAGNLLVQAMGVGRVRDLDHLRAIVRGSFRLERFEPADPGPWEDAMRRFDEHRRAMQ